MVKQLSISEARKRITSLEDELAFDDAISITNHGKEVFALLRWETYESIAETLEILSDEDAIDYSSGLKVFPEKSRIEVRDTSGNQI